MVFKKNPRARLMVWLLEDGCQQEMDHESEIDKHNEHVDQESHQRNGIG